MSDTAPQTIAELQQMVVKFRDARDWKQFHNAKDMALSLVLEAAEVLEHFQWKTEKDLETHVAKKKGDIGEELSDVLYWVLLMAEEMQMVTTLIGASVGSFPKWTLTM